MTRKVEHVIGDIHYEPHEGPSWLVCDTDGARFDAGSPDALADLWLAHGGKADKAAAVRAAVTARVTAPKPRCRFDGCTKLRSSRPIVPGYCTAHGYVLAGIEPPRPGRKAATHA